MRTKFKYNLKWQIAYLIFFALILIANLLLHHNEKIPIISKRSFEDLFEYFLVPFATPITFWILNQMTKSNDEIEEKVRS